jgi:K+-sensing histidine kinase KdpD
MLGLLAHDLRNPLSALHSNIGFLVAALNSESRDVKEAVCDAALSCDGLTHLIDGLETIAYVLGGAPELQKSPTALDGLLQDQVMKNQSVAESHEVGLAIVGNPSAVTVIAHRDMLARAVGAVLRYAIQHAPHRTEVHVELEVDTSHARVLVSDEGPRLEIPVQELAFTAEGQIRSKSNLGGRYSRGLGLYCAWICATVSGGTLRVVDARQEQNCFEIGVPLADT